MFKICCLRLVPPLDLDITVLSDIRPVVGVEEPKNPVATDKEERGERQDPVRQQGKKVEAPAKGGWIEIEMQLGKHNNGSPPPC